MSEKLIPISKRQHDIVNNLAAAIRENTEQLKTVASVLVLSLEEEIPKFGVIGAARSVDGVYSLVLDVPDMPDEAPPA